MLGCRSWLRCDVTEVVASGIISDTGEMRGGVVAAIEIQKENNVGCVVHITRA